MYTLNVNGLFEKTTEHNTNFENCIQSSYDKKVGRIKGLNHCEWPCHAIQKDHFRNLSAGSLS